MKILFAGDIHADLKHADYLFRVASRFEVDCIFALGDFGYWPRFPKASAFAAEIPQMAHRYGIPVYWLDGNHEDHDSLDKLTGGVRDDFVPMGDRYSGSHWLWYSPRGHTWEWGGVRFMSVGGAYSVDKAVRKPGLDWFPQEDITDDDVDHAIAQGKVDVLLTHDVPSVAPVLEKLLIVKGRRYKLIPEAEKNRIQLEKVRVATRPKLLFHGHYHVNYRERIDGTLIVGLDCNGATGFSWHIFDTEEIHGEDSNTV